MVGLAGARPSACQICTRAMILLCKPKTLDYKKRDTEVGPACLEGAPHFLASSLPYTILTLCLVFPALPAQAPLEAKDSGLKLFDGWGSRETLCINYSAGSWHMACGQQGLAPSSYHKVNSTCKSQRLQGSGYISSPPPPQGLPEICQTKNTLPWKSQQYVLV